MLFTSYGLIGRHSFFFGSSVGVFIGTYSVWPLHRARQ